MLSFRRRASAPASLLLCALALGCSDNGTTNDGPATSGSGGTSSAGGSASGATGMGGGGQPQADTTNGGKSDAGASGAGGTTAGTGPGGNAGASGSGGSGPGMCGKQGTQADPGADGDGKKQIDGPYKPAAETQMHLENAPVGKVNDMPIGDKPPAPLIYAATKQYPGLNNLLKYEYWIYVPSQYKPGCPAALMVFQDGMHYVSTDTEFNTPTTFDNLIAKGEMPVTIAVFINPGEPGDGHYNGNEQPNRSAQYNRNSPDYANFLVDQFLAEVILPKFDIVDDPNGWGISGHSSGGIAAFVGAWYRPEKFHKVLTHDASFPLPGNYMNMSLMASVDASPTKPLRVYLMSGPSDLGGWYSANTTAFDKLTAKQYHVKYITETSGHFPPQAGVQDFAEALRWMWRGYAL